MKLPQLPSLWTWLNLGEVLTRLDEKVNPLDFHDHAFNYIGLEDIEGHTGQLVKSVSKTLGKNIKSVKNKFYRGDILYGKLRPALNKVYLAPDEGICSSDISVLRTKNDIINNEFVAYYLRTKVVNKRLSQLAVGGQLPRISYDSFNLTPIPIPPFPEQKQIVNILSQADGLRQSRSEILTMSQKIPPKLFTEMFGDPAKNENEYPIKKVDNICTLVRGSSPRPQGDSKFYGGSIPRLMVADLTRDGFYVTPRIDSLTELGATKSRGMLAGEVVMAVSGAPGLACILKVDACIHDGFVGFRELSKKLHPEYFLGVLDFFKLRNEQQAVGAIFKNLSTDQVKGWTIPVPPIEKQREYSLRFRKIYEETIKMSLASSHLNELLNGTIIEAFTGGLTVFWRKVNKVKLEKAVQERNDALGISKNKVAISVYAPEERPWLSQPNRHWLMDQLSEFQGFVYDALREWKGTLIPSEDLEAFREQAFPLDHLEDANDQILRALHQLAGLGLIAKISLYNHEGDYITAFRGLREEELSQVSDRQYLAKG